MAKQPNRLKASFLACGVAASLAFAAPAMAGGSGDACSQAQAALEAAQQSSNAAQLESVLSLLSSSGSAGQMALMSWQDGTGKSLDTLGMLVDQLCEGAGNFSPDM